MILQNIQRLVLMAVLVAGQQLVFNHVHLFGYATPLPFVYLLLLFPLGTERWVILLWGFVCGLLADIVSLTPGVGAASMTLTAFVQPPLLALLAPKDAVADMRAGYATMGFRPYVRYVFILVAIFVITYFLVLSFSFHDFLDWLLSLLSSLLLTLFFCLVFEGFRKKKHE